MTASNASSGPRPAPATVVSGPTSSPWLKILAVSSGAAGAVLLLASAAAWLITGWGAALSAFFSGAVVLLFFGLSLLVGHFVGRSDPSGAMRMFIVVYLIKVFGFAAVLFAVGQPQWLDPEWFLGAAVVTVVSWQVAEVAAFAKTRHLLYADDGTSGGGDAHAER